MNEAEIKLIDGEGKHARWIHECFNEEEQYWMDILHYSGYGGVRHWYSECNSLGASFFCPNCGKKLPKIGRDGDRVEPEPVALTACLCLCHAGLTIVSNKSWNACKEECVGCGNKPQKELDAVLKIDETGTLSKLC